MRQSKHDNGLLYVMQNKNEFKTYDLVSREFGEIIYTGTKPKDRPKTLDVNDKYCFFFEESVKKIMRVNVKTGERQQLEDGIGLNLCFSLEIA